MVCLPLYGMHFSLTRWAGTLPTIRGRTRELIARVEAL